MVKSYIALAIGLVSITIAIGIGLYIWSLEAKCQEMSDAHDEH
jgi:hypothetical protein